MSGVLKIKGQQEAYKYGQAVRRAVLLAAGTGTRLRPLTAEVPKCLVEVAGESIVERALRVLRSQGVGEVVIVVGHCGEKLRERLGSRFADIELRYVEAPDYATTNNIRSLWDARSALDRDVILIEGDLIFDEAVISALLAIPGSSAAVVPVERAPSGTKVILNETNRVVSFLLSGDEEADHEIPYKTANIYLLRQETLVNQVVPGLLRAIASGHVDRYYESVFCDLVRDGRLDLTAVDVSACQWCEIDDRQDLAVAEFMMLDRESQYDRLQRLHGSYWRYGVTDHAYIYNVYFPTTKLVANLKANLTSIVSSYPANQVEMARLVGQWTGQDPHHIAVGNGASELIKSLATHEMRRLTVPTPTFNEYEAVVADNSVNRVPLDQRTFELNIDAFMQSALGWGSDMAVIASPNNPTGLSVPRKQLLDLCRHLAAHNCRLMVDESFVEFSRAGCTQSVEDAVVEHHNLVVIKSLSKVFGIAGLRLGYIVSADTDFIQRLRRALPIWNVNGLAEEFLRTIGAYRSAFVRSCALARASACELEAGLSTVEGVTLIKSDANFILCRLDDPEVEAADVARRLFVEHRILVKDCSTKTMKDGHRYLRISSRTHKENRRLVSALVSVLLP